ncbi:MAG: prenyltransferase [Desulfovibrionaceae bacterium]|nr:prenyltransferase [Desulfovibrionaceae bacterium]
MESRPPDTQAPRLRETFKAWWQASRPPFYIATLIPLVLGYLAAAREHGPPDPLIFCGALLVCFFLHLTANLGNDLFDHLQGTDTHANIGGSRVLQEGKISPRRLGQVIAVCYILAFALTGLGVFLTGLRLLWLLTSFGAFSSFFYVAPPIRYGYRALGELFVFLNMGLIMVEGVYYALSGAFSAQVLALAVPVGLMVAAILYYQSLPEIESDKAMGKNTLAGRLGPEKAFFLFGLWWPAIWTLMGMLFLCGLCSWKTLPGIALCLPLHLKACRKLKQAGGDWFSLDRYGYLTRLMYLICGLSLILGVYSLKLR